MEFEDDVIAVGPHGSWLMTMRMGKKGWEEQRKEEWRRGREEERERERVEGLIHASSFLTMSMFGEWGSIFVVRMSKLLRCLRREDVREVGNVLDEGREGREDECA